MKFRFAQITPRGLWISPGVFQGSHDDIVAMVTHGHVLGQPRAAVEEGSGRVIFSLDSHGHTTPASAAMFDGSAARATAL
ncbi:hypothetical protein BH11PSE8_BH11PSE8_15040 [soil metagenome]